MALANNARRSFRDENENAGGDNYHNNHLKVHHHHPKTDTFSESRLNLEQAAELDAEHRYFGGLIGNKEMLVLTAIGVAVYLINGEYAQTLCTTLTSIPPAIFSYRVLISQKTSREGYHSILFYWTIYGLLALLDQFCGGTQGYNLLKGGLLCTVFLHALRSNPSAIPATWRILDHATVEMLSSIYTQIDSMGFVKRTESSGFEPASPTITHFSDDDLVPITSCEMLAESEDVDVSTACSFTPTITMQSTQRVTPGETVLMKTATPLTPGNPPSAIRLNRKNPQYESISALSNSMVAPAGKAASPAGEILTVPADRIELSKDRGEATIRVTNISPRHVMFALKTNADTYLIAAPTTGVLLSGQTMTIRVGVIDQYFEDCVDPGRSIDKLAIDYAAIPQSSSISQFSPQLFQSANRRRHAIRVFYN